MLIQPRRIVLAATFGILVFIPLQSFPQSKEILLFPVVKDGSWGYIDSTGKIAIPPKFESVGHFHDGLARAVERGKVVFIDPSGKIVLRPEFQIVEEFSEGLAAVNNGQRRIPNLGIISEPGRWGYIDTTGKLAIPLKFTHAESFSERLAAVAEGDRTGFIDHTGKILFDVPLDVTLGFHEGVVGALFRGSVAYFDSTGKKLATPPIDYGPKSNSFAEGLVALETKGKYGYVDKTGKIAIPATFEDAEDFSEGFAAVRVPMELSWCPQDDSGSRVGSTKKWGYIDKSGSMVVPAQFEYAGPFVEGLAGVSNCSKSGFIDKTGKLIIPLQFDEAFAFHGGLAQVYLRDGRLGYIDKIGKTVWTPSK